MNKRRAGIALAIAAVLGLGFLLYNQMVPDAYTPVADEIVLHIQLGTKEDFGLLVFDYRADGHEYSSGMSNADRSFIKRDSDNILVWKTVAN